MSSTFVAFRMAAKRIRLDTQIHVRPLHTSATTCSNYSNAEKYQRPKNQNIPFDVVHLVDTESGSGKLIQTTKAEILATMDKNKYFLELQASDPIPVVKIHSIREAMEKMKLAKQQKKKVARKNAKKEFQFTWGMAGGDLEHKLGRAKEELRKGGKVDLVFAPKPKQRPPSVDEMRDKMQFASEKLADVSKEWKPRELKRGLGAIFFQSLNNAVLEDKDNEEGEGSNQ